VHLTEKTTTSATVIVSLDELRLLNNALVCAFRTNDLREPTWCCSMG
jgi:hypothetical protein